MKKILKRIAAYLIDIIIVSLISTLITSNSYVNKDYDNYNKVYKEYNELNNNYHDVINDLEKYNKDENISDVEYNKLIKDNEEYQDIIESQKLDSKFYNKLTKKIEKDYNIRNENYSYKMIKLSSISTIISIMLILLYFVVFQYYLGNQTIGKKLLKLKVVSNNGKDLTLVTFFIRALILNGTFINIINVICVLTLSKKNYIFVNQTAYIIMYIVYMVTICMVMFDKGNRGLHDYASNTKVVEI